MLGTSAPLDGPPSKSSFVVKWAGEQYTLYVLLEIQDVYYHMKESDGACSEETWWHVCPDFPTPLES